MSAVSATPIIDVGPWLSLRPPTSSTFRPLITITSHRITALSDCPFRCHPFGVLSCNTSIFYFFLRANIGSSSENSACQSIRLAHVSDFLRAKLSGNCPVIRDSFEKNSVFHEKNGYFNINLQKMHLTVLGFSKKL